MRQETKSILALAGPLMLAQGGYMLMGIVDTLVVGRVGALDMASVALGNGLVGVIMVFGVGVGLGVEPLVGQAYGAHRYEAARTWLWQGVWLVALLALPMMIIALAMTLPIVPAGISPEIAERTTDYVWARLPSVPLNCLAIVTRSYLSNVGRPRPALWAALWANLLNVALDVVLVLGLFGLPRLGAVGAGFATSGCMLLIAAYHSIAIHYLWNENGDASEAVPSRGQRRASLSKMREIFHVGWPIGLQMMAEVGIFAAVAALIGRLGDQALAAHQIALSLASFVFMCAVGIGSATTARVGYHVGAGRQAEARGAGFLGILLGSAFMAVCGAIFILFATPLSRLFSHEPEVYQLGATLLRVAGVFAIGDGVQVVAAGALRGAADTRVAFYVNLAAHWVIGLPLGLFLAHQGGLDVAGYWWGLTAGLTLVAILLTLRFNTLSKRPLERIERAGPA